MKNITWCLAGDIYVLSYWSSMTNRIMNRGTSVLELEACPSSSAGVLYQKCQEKSMSSLPENRSATLEYLIFQGY